MELKMLLQCSDSNYLVTLPHEAMIYYYELLEQADIHPLSEDAGKVMLKLIEAGYATSVVKTNRTHAQVKQDLINQGNKILDVRAEIEKLKKEEDNG